MRKRFSNTVINGRSVQVGNFYRSYNGTCVEVIAIAENVETGHEMVVYRTRHEQKHEIDDMVLTCTVETFLGDVQLGGVVKTRYREVLIGVTRFHDKEWVELLESSPMRSRH